MFNQLSFAAQPEVLTRIMQFTVAIIAAWILASIVVLWRRGLMNLTPVEVPSPNRNAVPDFLTVDHGKRNAALERGDQYARERDNEPLPPAKLPLSYRVLGWVALGLSSIAIGLALVGAIFPQSHVGVFLEEHSVGERLVEVFAANPIAITAAVLFVIVCAAKPALIRSTVKS